MPAGADARLPSEEMRAVRGLSFPQQRDRYVVERLRDQQTWCARKSRANKKRRKQWLSAAGVSYIVGFLVALSRAVGWVETELLGLAAAAGTAALAWTRAREHATLTEAYATTSQELLDIITASDAVTHENWPEFVADAETAISREHIRWIGRRRMGVEGA